MSVDFLEIGRRLAIAVRDSPGNSEADPEVKAMYQKLNGQRIWEIWMQCQTFDSRDHQFHFSSMSGLPSGIVSRYLDVCRKYQEDRATQRIKEARASKKTQKVSKRQTAPAVQTV